MVPWGDLAPRNHPLSHLSFTNSRRLSNRGVDSSPPLANTHPLGTPWHGSQDIWTRNSRVYVSKHRYTKYTYNDSVVLKVTSNPDIVRFGFQCWNLDGLKPVKYWYYALCVQDVLSRKKCVLWEILNNDIGKHRIGKYCIDISWQYYCWSHKALESKQMPTSEQVRVAKFRIMGKTFTFFGLQLLNL